MKITSDENVNQAVEQMVQAIRNTDAYLEYQKQLARVKEQPELKRQIDEFRTRNFELQTSKDTNFDKLDQFKLFVFDTGLLKHMAGIDNSAILLKADYQFKGPLTENYVLQQLRGQFEVAPRYYSDKNSEIDFVLQYGTEIIPVEAKGGEDKSAPSFKRYIVEHHPKHALRFSKRGYCKNCLLYTSPSPRDTR